MHTHLSRCDDMGTHLIRLKYLYTLLFIVGESNVGVWRQYNCSFPAMIADWRNKFYTYTGGLTDSAFPFGFVQVSM